MTPGQDFTKTWRLKNTGSCTWTKAYSLAFVSGDSMGAPASTSLPGEVPPGATVDLSINLKAPTRPAKYTGYWKLRNEAGVLFGVQADEPFYVVIEVVGPTPSPTITPTLTTTPQTTQTPVPSATLTPIPNTPTVTPAAEGVIYDFTAAACQAEWRSAAGVLACPSNQGDVKGAVVVLDHPVLETGDTETHPVLLTQPQIADNGAITGTYPALMIHDGDHFRATLGCLSGFSGCKVKYQLNYREGSNPPQNLGEWTQTSDGAIQGINVDLSTLAGKNVQLILVVLYDGAASDQNMAVWIFPRISKG